VVFENEALSSDNPAEMQFHETRLSGVFRIDLEPHRDERGFFARSWCQKEFEAHGLNAKLVQCNISFNAQKGTLRGMHFQSSPFAETKLVRCTMGAIYDVVIDLRPQSPTFRQGVNITLTAANRLAIYIPEGCAHGFLTLEDNTEVFYQMSEFYNSASSSGVRWDDPAFQISWPIKPLVISERDRKYPDFQ
jgi:dTDP-4-dehydrorhamnose 3,5-epimerase